MFPDLQSQNNGGMTTKLRISCIHVLKVVHDTGTHVEDGDPILHCKKFIMNHVDLLPSKWCYAIDNMKSYVLKPQLN